MAHPSKEEIEGWTERETLNTYTNLGLRGGRTHGGRLKLILEYFGIRHRKREAEGGCATPSTARVETNRRIGETPEAVRLLPEPGQEVSTAGAGGNGGNEGESLAPENGGDGGDPATQRHFLLSMAQAASEGPQEEQGAADAGRSERRGVDGPTWAPPLLSQIQTGGSHSGPAMADSTSPTAPKAPEDPGPPSPRPKQRMPPLHNVARTALTQLDDRPDETALKGLTNPGLRALLVANGIRRASTDRQADFVRLLLAYLAEDPARRLAFPAKIEAERALLRQAGRRELAGRGGEAEGSCPAPPPSGPPSDLPAPLHRQPPPAPASRALTPTQATESNPTPEINPNPMDGRGGEDLGQEEHHGPAPPPSTPAEGYPGASLATPSPLQCSSLAKKDAQDFAIPAHKDPSQAMDGEAVLREPALRSPGPASPPIDAPKSPPIAQRSFPSSPQPADNEAQPPRDSKPVDSPRPIRRHQPTSPPMECQRPAMTPPPSSEDHLTTSPRLPPPNPMPKPSGKDIQAAPEAGAADQRQALHSGGRATSPAENQPPPKQPTHSPKARLTARQCQLMRRLPQRPSSAELEVLSDAGLRALMRANGLPRGSDQRRGDYVAAIAAWLAGDAERQLAFPGSVERTTGGEPAPPIPPSRPPPLQPSVPADLPVPTAAGSPELVPALAEIGATLRAILAAVRADHAAGKGGGTWALVGRAEAAAEKASLVAAAFTAGQMRGEAHALARQRGALEALRMDVAAKRSAPAQPSQGARRSWRDVVAGSAGNCQERSQGGLVGRGSLGGTTRGRKWEPSRTIFLSPTDSSVLKRHVDCGLFGAALGKALKTQEPGTLVRTGAGLFKVELDRNAVEKILDLETVNVPGFGAWRASRMHASSMPSVVVSGVDPAMSDDAVATGLITGTRGMLTDDERRHLGTLRVKRLFLGAHRRSNRSDQDNRPSTSSEGESSPPTPTRSVRVYANPMILAKFEAMGEVKLDWALLPCRPYVPRQFYCQICGRMGGHSTERHRGSVREGERRDGRRVGGGPRP